MNDQTRKLLSSLQRQCSRREYCSEDIYRKAMLKLSGDADAARELLEALKEEGYVDDLRYAGAFAREKAGISGWGPVKIRFALSAKKIDRATVDAALGEIDESGADARLSRLLENKFKSLESDPQAKLKLLKFALGRGYEYDRVRSLVDRICSGD